MSTYIVSDPNTPESQQGRFVQYTDTQLANSAPFWAGVPSSDPTGAPGDPSGGSCGLPPNPADYFLGYFDPQYIAADTAWAACMAQAEAGGAVDSVTGGIMGAIQAGISSVLGAAASALKRVGVFVIGFAVVLLGGLMLYRGTVAARSSEE